MMDWEKRRENRIAMFRLAGFQRQHVRGIGMYTIVNRGKELVFATEVIQFLLPRSLPTMYVHCPYRDGHSCFPWMTTHAKTLIHVERD